MKRTKFPFRAWTIGICMFATSIKDVAPVRVCLMILGWSLLEPSNRVAKVMCFGELAAPPRRRPSPRSATGTQYHSRDTEES